MQPSLERQVAAPARATADGAATWAGTRALIASDFMRLAGNMGQGGWAHRLYWFLMPNFQALFLYRLSRYLYLKRWPSVARLVSLFSLYLTRVELPPTTSIGPGCLIAHASGVIFYGKAGSRLTLHGNCGTGGGFSEEDIGGGPGYPVLGDNVQLGQWCAVLGPVRVGDDARIGAGTIVTRDVPAGGVAIAPRCKIMRPGVVDAADAGETH